MAVLFDVAFLSNFQFYDANILFSVAILFTLAVFDKRGRRVLIFSLATVFFFAILSSLSLWMILFGFLLLPLALNLICRRFFPEPNILTILLFSLPFLIIFGLIILASAGEISAFVFRVLIAFVVINQILISLITSFYMLFGRYYFRKAGFIKG